MWILEEEFPSDVSLLLSNAASGDLSQGIHNVEPIPMFPRSSGDVLATDSLYLVRLLRLFCLHDQMQMMCDKIVTKDP